MLAESSEAAHLVRAIRQYQVVHDGVARKLVPGGKSLLQQSIRKRRPQDIRVLNVIYDNYFWTLRASVSRQDVVAQLLRRVMAVVQDATCNGLYSSAVEGAADESAALRLAEVIECEGAFAEIMFRVACQAAELPTDDVTEYYGLSTDSSHRERVSAWER
jgi:hypothetical protein